MRLLQSGTYSFHYLLLSDALLSPQQQQQLPCSALCLPCWIVATYDCRLLRRAVIDCLLLWMRSGDIVDSYQHKNLENWRSSQQRQRRRRRTLEPRPPWFAAAQPALSLAHTSRASEQLSRRVSLRCFCCTRL